jgi:hypothetical protein
VRISYVEHHMHTSPWRALVAPAQIAARTWRN